ncbi:MAG TPA: acyl-CoA dehydrogenase family protein, partial [Burkholderiaceae bacterium]|nr:acyl-CoA dehydrogenase family protein [Burkholderiaceae bacterium]
MDFALTPEQESIRESVKKVCAAFGDDYWLRKDREGGFPDELYQALARDGWLGICIPEEYGGSGLG